VIRWRGQTRAQIWKKVAKEDAREDFAEADLFNSSNRLAKL
jgi:hypothetical protein